MSSLECRKITVLTGNIETLELHDLEAELGFGRLLQTARFDLANFLFPVI